MTRASLNRAHSSSRAVLAWALVVAFGAAGDVGSAQEIDVRLSIKYILDANGLRPPGTFSTNASIQNTFTQVNQTLRRWNRGYQYIITEFQDVAGRDPFFNIDSTLEYYSLEDTAEANAAAFSWRTDAVNIFIVNTSVVGGGAAAIPSNPNDAGYELVIFTVNVIPADVIWPHELGHHFNLYHTFNDDGVADTRPDPNPFQCMAAFQCPMGGSMECCCATKAQLLNTAATSGGWTQAERDNIQFNNMSYHCGLTLANLRMTDGQLDRWTDASRRYHAGEVSGLTYFVDGTNITAPFTGYSTDPYRTVAGALGASDPSGGDIVLIRAGSYDEPMTINRPVTLRASRGTAVIGE